jgi:tetratricopeptide (TPR) repeat protein
MGRYDDALADFDRALELDPGAAWTVASRGLTYQAMGRYDDALADFDRALELDPNLTNVIGHRAREVRGGDRPDPDSVGSERPAVRPRP